MGGGFITYSLDSTKFCISRVVHRMWSGPSMWLCVLLAVALNLAFLSDLPRQPWSLKPIVHAAVLAFFLLIKRKNDNHIAQAFFANLAAIIVKPIKHLAKSHHMPAAIADAVYIAVVLTALHLLCSGTAPRIRPSALAALLATLQSDIAANRLADGMAFAAHRAFMCALGFVDYPSMRIAFVYAQFLLALCYAADGSSTATALALFAVVFESAAMFPKRAALLGINGYSPPLRKSPKLPLMRLELGGVAVAAAIVQASVLFIDETRHNTVNDGPWETLTQYVHVAAVLSAIVVLGPLISEQRLVKGAFFCAGILDGIISLLFREAKSLDAKILLIMRVIAGVSVSISYAVTGGKFAMILEGDNVVGKKPLPKRAYPFVAICTYALAHCLPIIRSEFDLDMRIAYAFHFPFLIASFSFWALVWQDEAPWWMAIIFCLVECIACAVFAPRVLDLVPLAVCTALLVLALCRLPVRSTPSFVVVESVDP